MKLSGSGFQTTAVLIILCGIIVTALMLPPRGDEASSIRLIAGRLSSHSTGSHHNHQQHQQQRPTFLMVLGVEGTGHHLYESIYGASPSFRSFNETFGGGLDDRPYKTLTTEFKALFRAGCTGKPQHDPPATNRGAILAMREMDSKLLAAAGNDTVASTAIAVNGFRSHYGGSYLSYPFGQQPDCRYLAYPDLDLYYRTCDEASVRCRHVVMHRDAYEVIRSTTMNRQLAPNKLSQIKVLTYMLDVIRAQMLDHPDRLAACWDYDTKEGIEGVGRALGWESDEEFGELFGNVFVAPRANLTEEERRTIIPPHLRVFMDTMVRGMRSVADTCRALRLENERGASR